MEPTSTHVEPELLDVKQTAVLCGCSPRHVFNLVTAGKLPAPVKLGRLVRWRTATLKAWLAELEAVQHHDRREQTN